MSVSKSNPRRWTMFCQGYDQNLNTGVKTSNAVTKDRAATNSVVYGDNVSDWRRKIALGQSATTTLEGTFYTLRETDMTVEYRYTAGGIPHVTYDSGAILGYQYHVFNPPQQTLDDVADNKARAKFLQHYLECRNTWRGGNFLAEVRETIHMLAHPVSSLYRSVWKHAENIGKLRKIYKKQPADLLKHLSDAWLAWAFGVKPLLSDCDDASTALNNLATGDWHDQKTISGFGRNTVGTSSRLGGQSVPFGTGGWTYEKFVQTSNTIRYRAAMVARPENTGFLIQQFGVGIYDALPAVWEGTPWSFFVDYFLNVQEVLDGMRLWSADFGWQNATIRNSGLQHLYGPAPNASPPSRIYLTGGRHYALQTYVHRAPGVVPAPKFYFRMPGFPSLKWLNIAALAKQVQFAQTGHR